MADIIHRIGIKAPISKVYAAVASAEGIAGWWTRDTTGETKGSSRFFTVRFFTPTGAEMATMTFEMVKLDPDKEVVWRCTEGFEDWVGTEITFNFTREDDYTIVIFGHRRWREATDAMAHCSMKWATFLLSLRQLAETGTGKPAPNDLKIDNWN